MDDISYLQSLTSDELYDYLNNKRKIEDYRTISASSLKTFLECRLKYFFQYIKDWRIVVRSPNFSIGTAFHAACELDNKNQAMGIKSKKADLFNEFELVWNAEEIGLKKDFNGYLLDSSHKIGLDLVERYFNSGVRKSIKAELVAPYISTDTGLLSPAVELHIDIPLYSYKLDTVMRDDFRVTGFIDLVATANDKTKHFDKGDLLIVDYKTAAKTWSSSSVNTNLQILLYAYAIRYLLKYTNNFSHLNKDKEDYIGIICLQKGRNLKSGFKASKLTSQFIKVEDKDIDYLEKLLLKTAEDIHRDQESIDNWLPSPEENKCRWCQFQNPCLSFRKGAPLNELEDWYLQERKKN